jgi:hypothetical protein
VPYNWNKLFSKLNKKQSKDKQLAWDRRLQWECLESEINRIFAKINQIAKENMFYENMYIETTDEMHNRDGVDNNQKAIFIFFGNRPTYLRKIEYKNGLVVRKKIVTETGGCLTFSQSGKGEVVVLYNFPKSEAYSRKELVYPIYSAPFSLLIWNRRIYRHIYRFIRIEQHCSIYGTLPFNTRIWLFWHEKRYQVVNAFIAAMTGFITSLIATVLYEYIYDKYFK